MNGHTDAPHPGGLSGVQEGMALRGLVKGISLTPQCVNFLKKKKKEEGGSYYFWMVRMQTFIIIHPFRFPFQVSHLRTPPSSAQPRALFQCWQERGRDGATENSVNTELHTGLTGCPR